MLLPPFCGGEIDTLLDKTEKLTGTINAASENLQVTINQLEGAGDSYHQAVLAANLHHKNEMVPSGQKPQKTIV